MNEMNFSEKDKLVASAKLAADFISSVELVLVGEDEVLYGEYLTLDSDQFDRVQYSPIFREATVSDRAMFQQYKTDISHALSSLKGDDVPPSLLEAISKSSLKMQELMLHLLIRDKMMDEEDLVDMFGGVCGANIDPVLMYKNDAPLLADFAMRVRELGNAENTQWRRSPS